MFDKCLQNNEWYGKNGVGTSATRQMTQEQGDSATEGGTLSQLKEIF